MSIGAITGYNNYYYKPFEGSQVSFDASETEDTAALAKVSTELPEAEAKSRKGGLSTGVKLLCAGTVAVDILATKGLLTAAFCVPAVASGCKTITQEATKKCDDPKPNKPEGGMGTRAVCASEYDDPNGADFVYDHEDQKPDAEGNPGHPAWSNCNGTTRDIEVTCHFNGEDVTFYPDENGLTRPHVTFYAEPASASSCWLTSYYNPNTGRAVKLDWEGAKTEDLIVSAWKPPTLPDSVCEDHEVCSPQVTSASLNFTGLLDERGLLTYGATVPIAVNATNCYNTPSNTITATLEAGVNFENGLPNTFSMIPGGNGYYSSNLNAVYDYWQKPVRIIVRDAEYGTSVIREVWELPSLVPVSGSVQPAAIISPNLLHTHHVGDVVNDITCITDDPNPSSISWVVTCSDTGVQTFQGATILGPWEFNQEGQCLFRCQVVASDGITPGYGVRKVEIYPPEIEIPTLSIDGPMAVEQEVSFNLSVVDPDTANYDYLWQYAITPFSSSGTMVSLAYANPGPKTIVLTATHRASGYEFSIPFTVTVVPHGNPVPNLKVTPGMGESPLNVVADARASYATGQGADVDYYIFNWGDGSNDQIVSAGSTAQHQYSCTGNSVCGRTVRLTVVDTNGKSSTLTAAVAIWPPSQP